MRFDAIGRRIPGRSQYLPRNVSTRNIAHVRLYVDRILITSPASTPTKVLERISSYLSSLRAALHITAGQTHALTGSVTVRTEIVSHVGGNCASMVALLMQVVQPDVVLVTYDALTSDISQLQPIEWEAIVVDERNRIQPSLSKAHQALRELDANFRLLLASGNPTKVCFCRVICCQTHEDVALLLAAAKDDQKINCTLVREVHLRLSNTLSYSALVT